MGDPRVALITGGSKGIGFSIANRLAERGIENLLLISRKEADLKQAQDSLQSHHARTTVDTFSADLADPASYDKLYRYVEQQYGKIDILVNNAGEFFQLGVNAEGKPVDKDGKPLSPSEVAAKINSTYALNAAAPAIFAIAFRKLLLNASHPKVLDVLSSAAVQVYNDNIPYRQSKLAHEDTSTTLQMYTNDVIRTYRLYPSNTDTGAVAHFNFKKLTPEAVAKAGVDMVLDNTATDLAIRMQEDGYTSVASFRAPIKKDFERPFRHTTLKRRTFKEVFVYSK